MKAGRRGAALIVVLAMLALLALFATAFSTLTGVERRVSRNYLDTVRARLAAESGVEAALARLQNRMLRGALWTDLSWSVADDREIRLDGHVVRDAGFLDSGSYAEHGGFHRVRISDAQARQYLQAAAGCVHCAPAAGSDFEGLGRNLMDRAAAFEVRIRTIP
jgi:hypothetical protein